MSGKAEELTYFELILNVLGTDFFKKSKQLKIHESKDLLSDIKLEK
ncbi:MAG: hypothetical protein ACM3YE_07760 [Bacteroidota bacterium]